MIKNLVIGSEGFVGSQLCAFLEQRGEKVLRFDIKRTEREDARHAKLPLKKVDRVYFLAWEVGGAKYLYRTDTQLHQLNWNIELLRNVMPQLEESKVPFVFVSSQLAEETDTVYGVTKKIGELWTTQLSGICARLWNIYGALEGESERSHVVGDFVNQAITTGEIKMLSTGEERRQFIHIEDACAGLHHVMENNFFGETYDLTSFEWTTILNVAQKIGLFAKAEVIPGKLIGVSKKSVVKGKPPGWIANISLDAGLRQIVEKAIASKKRKK